MKSIFILLLMMSCQKPETICFHCQSPQMQNVTFCGYSEDEMQSVIDWRKEYLQDTLVCVDK